LGDKSNDPTNIEKTKNKLAFENERDSWSRPKGQDV